MFTWHYSNNTKIIELNVFKRIKYGSQHVQIFLYQSGSWNAVSGAATAALPGDPLAMHILCFCPQTTNSEPLRVHPAICGVTSPRGDSDIGSYLETVALPNQWKIRDVYCFCWIQKKLANLDNPVYLS